MDIVVVGFAGRSGSQKICGEEPYRSALLKRYSKRFLAGLFDGSEGQNAPEPFWQTGNQGGFGSAEPSGTCEGPGAFEKLSGPEAFLKSIGVPEEHRKGCEEGGIFAALWALLHENRLGGAFCQREIPIRQQTVEICEQYGLNPYRLSGKDCAICLCEEGGKLVQKAAEQGLPAAVIGFTEKGPAIRRLDCEETAYLRRPEPDELYRLFPGRSGSGRSGAETET